MRAVFHLEGWEDSRVWRNIWGTKYSCFEKDFLSEFREKKGLQMTEVTKQKGKKYFLGDTGHTRDWGWRTRWKCHYLYFATWCCVWQRCYDFRLYTCCSMCSPPSREEVPPLIARPTYSTCAWHCTWMALLLHFIWAQNSDQYPFKRKVVIFNKVFKSDTCSHKPLPSLCCTLLAEPLPEGLMASSSMTGRRWLLGEKQSSALTHRGSNIWAR